MTAPNTIPIPTYPNSGGVTPAVTIADGANTTQGAIADAAVSTDAAGTVNAHLRGIVKLLAAGITSTITGNVATTVADGSNITQGGIADAAVSTDANGTVNAHIRGIVKLIAGMLGSVGSPSTNVLTVQGATLGQAVTVATASGTPIVVQENTYAGTANGILLPGASAANFPSVAGHLMYITAAKANTGTIYIGLSNAVTSTTNATNTTTGLELQAGQSVGPLPITNANDLWAKATVSTDGLTYLVL